MRGGVFEGSEGFEEEEDDDDDNAFCSCSGRTVPFSWVLCVIDSMDELLFGILEIAEVCGVFDLGSMVFGLYFSSTVFLGCCVCFCCSDNPNSGSDFGEKELMVDLFSIFSECKSTP